MFVGGAGRQWQQLWLVVGGFKVSQLLYVNHETKNWFSND